METNSKTATPLDLPDRIRAIADRLDEAFCAGANTPDCRALEPADLITMMAVLIDIADEVETNNEVMVRVASAYEACKAAFGATVPVVAKPKPRLSIVTTAVLVSSAGDVA
jgi:hypothetical protein